MGFRVPTRAELEEEMNSWSSSDSNGAFGIALKLPMAGNRQNSDASVSLGGTWGLYWSSTAVSGGGSPNLSFSTNSNSAAFYDVHRVFGSSVRCIKE
jgi:hypothetical protein